MLIPLAFFGILIVTFSVLALVGAPSTGEKVLERRMVGIRSANSDQGNTPIDLTQLMKVQAQGKFFGLEDFLARFAVAQAIEKKIMQANVKTSAGKLLLTCCGFGVVGFFLCDFFLPILGVELIVAGVLAYLPWVFLSFKRSRRMNAFNAALPDAIDMMSRALRAGHSMIAAISVVAEQSVEPVRTEFNEVFQQQNFGLPLRDALMQMLDHIPSQDLRVLVTAMLVQKETGGNLAEILDRTVFVIRERLRIHGEIRTHTAQGRMTGWILCMLPIVLLGIINMINPGYSSVLFSTSMGHKLLYAGIGLLVAGGLIIRQIINGIEV